MSALLFLLSLWLTDGELYAGVYIDFMGTDSAIFRTLGKQTAMRTDQYNSRWLNGNVSTHGLFCSQHYFFHSSLSRVVLIYSSAPELHCCNVSLNFTYVAPTQSCVTSIPRAVPSRNEIVDLYSLLHMTTWSLDCRHKMHYANCWMRACRGWLQGQCCVVSGGNHYMSMITESNNCSLMNCGCHGVINAGWVLSVDDSIPITASPSVAGSQILLWPCCPDNSPLVVVHWIGTPESC